MTPVGTRDAMYCRFGSRKRDTHPKYFTKDAAILALLHDATDGRTFTRYSFVTETADAAALAKAEERWRRANKRYTLGGINDEEYEREAATWKAAQSASGGAEDGLNYEVQKGMPYVRWDADTATVNGDLRRLFNEVRLDPATLAPVEVVWRNPRMARRS